MRVFHQGVRRRIPRGRQCRHAKVKPTGVEAEGDSTTGDGEREQELQADGRTTAFKKAFEAFKAVKAEARGSMGGCLGLAWGHWILDPGGCVRVATATERLGWRGVYV